MARIATTWMSLLLVTTALLVGCQTGTFRARNLPSEFRAAANHRETDLKLARLSTPGTSNALLAPGDLLEVTVATGREGEKLTPLLVRVANDGTVGVPIVGAVPVAGLEAFDAGQSIASAAIERGIYLRPLVTVDIKTKAVNRITVLGAVENPGVHEIPRGGCDVVTALAAAGGLTDEAGTELEVMRQSQSSTFMASNTNSQQAGGDVQLVAHQLGAGQNAPPQLLRIDLADARLSGRTKDLRLGDRDVVMVPTRKAEVIHVAGLVTRPGQFELPLDQDLHLLDAIALAGGRSSPVANKVYVIRRLEGRPEPIVIQASLSEAKHNGAENIRLAAGDTITIEQTPATTVVDTLSKLIRFSVGIAGRTAIF